MADTALRLRTDLKKSKRWWLWDRPYHPRYVTFSELGTRARLETDNANFGLVSHLVKILSRRGESEVDELLESVSHRFVGSPQRIELLVERAISKGHVDEFLRFSILIRSPDPIQILNRKNTSTVSWKSEKKISAARASSLACPNSTMWTFYPPPLRQTLFAERANTLECMEIPAMLSNTLTR